ncbi:hypothetical protein [Sphingomonas sp.]|uniref:hypothetical protein n=1 Tax=Sphingomonas sp. TaxID=28214 RepID=UPI0025FC0D77|nr:hypothetical protein [Sphingomonas sp.]
MRWTFTTIFVSAVAFGGVASAQVQSSPANNRPKIVATVAEAGALDESGGPLFQKVKQAFAAANQGNGQGFKGFLTPKAELNLIYFVDHELKKAPFTAGVIQAATKSCLGPFSIEEGSDWAQLSWVCRVDEDAPLAQLLKFRESPELSLTVWFDHGRIKGIDAMEPLSVPFHRYVSMDAYARMKGSN